MKIQLSEHFTYSKLLRFTFPSIIMMIFTSIYSVIDGLFVSNFAGKTALAAINIIYPFIMAVGALGFMMGTGGSALVGRLLGEGEKGKANKTFSLIVYTTAIAFSCPLWLFFWFQQYPDSLEPPDSYWITAFYMEESAFSPCPALCCRMFSSVSLLLLKSRDSD